MLYTYFVSYVMSGAQAFAYGNMMYALNHEIGWSDIMKLQREVIPETAKEYMLPGQTVIIQNYILLHAIDIDKLTEELQDD